MNLSKVIVTVTFLGILAMATHVSIDSDSWWHLRAGQYMVENQELITKDVFSYTSFGKPWQYPGLWVQIFMFQIFEWFGPGGLNLWVSLMVGTIFILVWMTTKGNILLRSIILMFSASASAIYWAARPYLFTYLLFALYFFILEKYFRQGKGKLWLLPILMVVWVNSHGGFLAGFLLIGPYLVDSLVQLVVNRSTVNNKARQQIITQGTHSVQVFFLMLGGSLLNPHGWKLWELPFSTVSRQAEQLFIAEWQSPDFHDPYLLSFGILLILILAVLGGSSKSLKLYEILLLSGFGILGLFSVRNIFFFVIITPAILSSYGTDLLYRIGDLFGIYLKLNLEEAPKGFAKILNLILVIIIGLISGLRIAMYLREEINHKQIENTYPVEAVEFIQEYQPQGQMFNSYNYGGYLIWALQDYPVFVDGRADLHQDEIILTWYRVINGREEWDEVFDEWEVGFVVLEPYVPLLNVLMGEGWHTIYQDELAIVAISPE